MSDANELDNFANELENLANNRIEKVIVDLDSVWKGESASMMINKCIIQKEKVFEQASNLRKYASGLRSAARQIKKAEEEAIALQKRREAEIANILAKTESNN